LILFLTTTYISQQNGKLSQLTSTQKKINSAMRAQEGTTSKQEQRLERYILNYSLFNKITNINFVTAGRKIEFTILKIFKTAISY
jgi:hypothetical protein